MGSAQVYLDLSGAPKIKTPPKTGGYRGLIKTISVVSLWSWRESPFRWQRESHFADEQCTWQIGLHVINLWKSHKTLGRPIIVHILSPLKGIFAGHKALPKTGYYYVAIASNPRKGVLVWVFNPSMKHSYIILLREVTYSKVTMAGFHLPLQLSECVEVQHNKSLLR